MKKKSYKEDDISYSISTSSTHKKSAFGRMGTTYQVKAHGKTCSCGGKHVTISIEKSVTIPISDLPEGLFSNDEDTNCLIIDSLINYEKD